MEKMKQADEVKLILKEIDKRIRFNSRILKYVYVNSAKFITYESENIALRSIRKFIIQRLAP